MEAKEMDPVEALQKVLRGEHMAIDVYSAVLDTVNEPSIKDRLEAVRNDHRRHADELATRIVRLGGDPPESTGIGGWAAKAGIRMRGWFAADPRGILRQVYDGEDQGISAASRIADENLDNESRALVERIMDEDRAHLHQLEQVIAEQSGDA